MGPKWLPEVKNSLIFLQYLKGLILEHTAMMLWTDSDILNFHPKKQFYKPASHNYNYYLPI